jgi:adenylylsulfate kinase
MERPIPVRDPAVIWFTGLSGAGKTTIALEVCRALRAGGTAVEYLDGDVIRSVMPQTGFSRADRDAHVRRVAFLASRLEHHGITVVVALISPYRDGREFARSLCGRFIEVHVATPLPVCEARDVKGFYARARRGEITQFTGIDDPYEPPIDPELCVDTRAISVDAAAQQVLTAVGAPAVIAARRSSQKGTSSW